MRLSVFTKNLSNPAYMAARLGADRAALHLGAEVTHHVPQIPDSVEQQIALIDEALALRPDGIVLSPVHSTAVDGAIRRIHAAGIPLVGVVTPINAVPVTSFVHSDDRALGRAIAHRLFTHLGGRGRVLVITGHVHSFTSLERLAGFHDAAADHPGIELLGPVAGDYVQDVAFERTTQWLATHGSPLEGCLVANDIMAIGAIEALQNAGRRAGVAVVGVNAIPEGVDAVLQGELLATADFNAMRMAYLATECAIRHLRGEPVPRLLQLPVQIVDRDNARQWAMPYAERATWTLAEALQAIGSSGTGRADWA